MLKGFLFFTIFVKIKNKLIMYQTLQSLHSTLAYIALIVLVLAVINAVYGLVNKKLFTSKDLRLSLFALIFCHIQLLIGIILYFVSEKGMKAFSIEGAMKNADLRLTMLEHPLINIIAIVLITIGWSKHKKQESQNGKFKKIAVFYALGLILILSRLPWSTWMA
jgi:NADH:ubiquinone oxidoreductase subunit 2 (subunit N)